MEVRVRDVIRMESETALTLFALLSSVIELQAILASVLEKFEFAMPPDADKHPVCRKPTLVMTPIVEGHRGTWLGLTVKNVA